MQIAGGLVAEFECDSNAVACPRLYPGRVRARRAGPRRRIGISARRRWEEKKIFKSMARRARRLELESTFRRTRVCASRIVVRSEMEGARETRSWTGKKYSNFDRATRAGCDDAFVERCLGEWFIYGVWWMCRLLILESRKVIGEAFCVTRPRIHRIGRTVYRNLIIQIPYWFTFFVNLFTKR